MMDSAANTYHDYVTDQELCEAGPGVDLVGAVGRFLGDVSGARNVASGVLHRVYDPSAMVTRLKVTFNSAAWTGR